MYCSNCGQRNDKQTRLCPACGAELQTVIEEHAIQEGLTTETTMQYAGFWRRFGAGIIDISLVGGTICLLYLLAFLIAGLFSSDLSLSTQWTIIIYGVLIILVISLLYFPGMESSSKRATLGKKVLGIIVTDREGHKISFWRAALRFLIKGIAIIPYGFLLLGVSCLTIAATQEKKALHDMVAGTRVIIEV